jgi:hypothetical protein
MKKPGCYGDWDVDAPMPLTSAMLKEIDRPEPSEALLRLVASKETALRACQRDLQRQWQTHWPYQSVGKRDLQLRLSQAALWFQYHLSHWLLLLPLGRRTVQREKAVQNHQD